MNLYALSANAFIKSWVKESANTGNKKLDAKIAVGRWKVAEGRRKVAGRSPDGRGRSRMVGKKSVFFQK